MPSFHATSDSDMGISKKKLFVQPNLKIWIKFYMNDLGSKEEKVSQLS